MSEEVWEKRSMWCLTGERCYLQYRSTVVFSISLCLPPPSVLHIISLSSSDRIYISSPCLQVIKCGVLCFRQFLQFLATLRSYESQPQPPPTSKTHAPIICNIIILSWCFKSVFVGRWWHHECSDVTAWWPHSTIVFVQLTHLYWNLIYQPLRSR